MKIGYGITGRLFVWFLIVVSISYGTILVLYIDVQHVVKLSETIVEKNNTISSVSKKMIENLLTMEESQKKHRLLKKNDYRGFFESAYDEFEKNLKNILDLEEQGFQISERWRDIDNQWRSLYSNGNKRANSGEDRPPMEVEAIPWIPESDINDWLLKIRSAQAENQKEVILTTQQLNKKGRVSARHGLFGLAVSGLVGLAGIFYLSYSMIRPLRKLISGIRGLSKHGPGESIALDSKDEFGELAVAFNEMTDRLLREEQMRSDFISMLSHEIRTPLTSIRESVNMLSEEVMGPVNKRQSKFLKIAGSEIERIQDLLNHLMQASRLEPGVLTIRPSRIDPYTFVLECVERIKPSWEAKKINMEITGDIESEQFSGDREKLGQALLNLIGNAVKFSDNRGTIIVGIKGSEKGGKVTFYVKDNGPGILEEDQTLLFNKYYRAQGVREHMDGVGLGLSITKSIVEAHKGNVWVKSSLGDGATFGFTLPAAKTA